MKAIKIMALALLIVGCQKEEKVQLMNNIPEAIKGNWTMYAQEENGEVKETNINVFFDNYTVTIGQETGSYKVQGKSLKLDMDFTKVYERQGCIINITNVDAYLKMPNDSGDEVKWHLRR